MMTLFIHIRSVLRM